MANLVTQLAPPPIFRAWDNNGNPLVNGQLFTYQAGTTNPQATYTDNTGSVPNTNPVILNARGEANVWLTPSLTYKLILQDSAGNLIWSEDQVLGGYVPYALLGQTLYPQTTAESSAGVTPTNYIYPPGHVLRYGTNTTPGTTDMTGAIQAALNVSSQSNSNCSAYAPAGLYFCASAISQPGNSVIRGDGRGNTTIRFNSAISTDAWTQAGFCGISRLTIDGNGSAHRGIVFTAATSPESWHDIIEVKGFALACLEFTTNGCGAQFCSFGSVYFTTGAVATQGAVRCSGIDSSATSRTFVGAESSGCCLFDFGGCNDFYVFGGFTQNLIFSSNSVHVRIYGMRCGANFVSNVTVSGGDHAIMGCTFANTSVTLDNTTTSIIFDSSVSSWNVIDNGTNNSVKQLLQPYTVTWAQSGGSPTIGNGTLQGWWSRNGDLITVWVNFTAGSTTTFGTGGNAWTFSLPRLDNSSIVQENGAGFTQSSGTGQDYQLTPQVQPGAGTVSLFAVNTAGTLVSMNTSTKTWASTTLIRFSLTYRTA